MGVFDAIGNVQGTCRLLDPGRIGQRGHLLLKELHRGKQSNRFPWETLRMRGKAPQSPDVLQGHVLI